MKPYPLPADLPCAIGKLKPWCLPIILLVATAARVEAQNIPAQWGGLRPGPHAVGYAVMSGRDHSRSYWPLADYRGRISAQQTSRPVQLTVWYPAEAEDDAQPISFGEYLSASATELGHGADTTRLREAQLAEFRQGPLSPFFDGAVPDSAFQRIKSMPVRAVRDAPRPARKFPVIIHPGFGGAAAQSTLFEYLASHGFIVVATPHLASGPAWYGRGEATAEALLDEADDVGFVIGQLANWDFADRSRVAVMGMGARAGVLYEMREMRLTAIVLLDAVLPPELRSVPGFGLERVRIPVLDIPNTQFPRARTIFDSLRYAPRTTLRLRDAPHIGFYQFRRIAQPELAAEHAQYEVTARVILAFLETNVKGHGDPASVLQQAVRGAPDGYAFLETTAALPPAPTEAEFLALIRGNDMREASRAYHDAKAREPERRLFDEQAMMTTVRFLVRDEGAAAAIPAAELLVDAYPESVNGHELLGRLYEAAGRRADALAQLERALSRLERRTTLTDRDEQTRTRLRENIERLRSAAGDP